MPEFEHNQLEPSLKRVSKEMREMREYSLSEITEIDIDSEEDKLFSAFELGLRDPHEYLRDPSALTTEQLAKIAKYLSIKDNDPTHLKELLRDRVSSDISLEDFFTIGEAIEEFLGYDFNFVEAIGWPRILMLHSEAVNDSLQRNFFDALRYVASSKPEHVLQAVDLLFEDTEYIERESSPAIIRSFYPVQGVSEKIANWILQKPRKFDQINYLVRLASQKDPDSAARLLPIVQQEAVEVIAAGKRFQQNILRNQFYVNRNDLYRDPDQDRATSLDWILIDILDALENTPEYLDQYHQALDLARELINSTQLVLFRDIFVSYIGSKGYGAEMLHNFKGMREDLYLDIRYFEVRRNAYEQSHATSAKTELLLIDNNLQRIKTDNSYYFATYITILREYASEEPELVMQLLESHARKSGGNTELFALLKTLDRAGLGTRVTEWKNTYLETEPAEEIVPIQDYLERQDYNLRRLGIKPMLTIIESELESLSPTEQRFIVMTLEKTGYLSDAAIKTLAEIPEKVSMQKTGSSIEVLARRHRGVLKHRIPTISATLWIDLADTETDPVQVAPVLKTNSPKGATQELYSRICGETLYEVLKKHFGLEWILEEDDILKMFDVGETDANIETRTRLSNILYGFADNNPLLKNICEQALRILDMLAEKGIQHGHPHLYNFTVECIDAEYLSTYLQSGGVTVRRRADFISQRPTTNNIPWSDQHFTFDMELLEKEPEKWTPIVRLIDFDQARELS